MQTDLRGRDLIGDMDFSKEEVETVIDVALKLKRDRALGVPHPHGHGPTAEQQISALIQAAKAIGVETNEIRIMGANNVVSAINISIWTTCRRRSRTTSFTTILISGSSATSASSAAMCAPSMAKPGVFTNLPSSPLSVRIEFHVGDSTNANDAVSIASGKGYQGVEVRISAAPRDLQYWYR